MAENLTKIERIESKIDQAAAGATEIHMGFGGVKFQSMVELMEFAKLMSVSGAAVPMHLRGNPGTCLAICTRALRFGFDPFALAEHSFAMSKSTKVDGQWQDVETIAYDSFVIHAIIEAHAGMTGRLRISYEGEGDERRCIVTGVPKGEREPLVFRSEPIKALMPKRNEKGNLKGSPLWETKPDVQLAYNARRDFCRVYFPEILLGWYDKDEFEEYAKAASAKDIAPTPGLKDRLKGKNARGFSGEHVERETAALAAPTQTPIAMEAVTTTEPEPVVMVNTEADASDPGSGPAPKGRAASPNTPARPASGDAP